MKNILLKTLWLCLLLIIAGKTVYAQKLTFTYDGAGNQITREFVCENCSTFPQSFAAAPTPADAGAKNMTIESAEKNKAITSRRLVAYPNPLTEILNMTWRAEKGVYVKFLEVASPSGNAIFKQEYPYSDLYTQSIPFEKQVPGMYTIKATYSDGKQEFIKVIKVNR